MGDVAIPTAEFHKLVHPMLGLTVSRAWKGFGSAIFLELGKLSPPEEGENNSMGEFTIQPGFDWRVEANGMILFGSQNSTPEIESRIVSFHGASVQKISVEGAVPEMVIEFSTGYTLHSMTLFTGQPEWGIRLESQDYIFVKNGQYFLGEGIPDPLSEQDKARLDLENRAAQRWGNPGVDPASGKCANCMNYIRLDGHGDLLDWGCCAAAGGPFDSHVVRKTSGCSFFKRDEKD